MNPREHCHPPLPVGRQRERRRQKDARRSLLEPNVADCDFRVVAYARNPAPKADVGAVYENREQVFPVRRENVCDVYSARVGNDRKAFEILPERVYELSVQIRPAVVAVQVFKVEVNPFALQIVGDFKNALVPARAVFYQALAVPVLRGPAELPVLRKPQVVERRPEAAGHPHVPAACALRSVGVFVCQPDPPIAVEAHAAPHAVRAPRRVFKRPQAVFERVRLCVGELRGVFRRREAGIGISRKSVRDFRRRNFVERGIGYRALEGVVYIKFERFPAPPHGNFVPLREIQYASGLRRRLFAAAVVYERHLARRSHGDERKLRRA